MPSQRGKLCHTYVRTVHAQALKHDAAVPSLPSAPPPSIPTPLRSSILFKSPMLPHLARAVFAGCGTAIFFSSTRVSTFATETEKGPGQLGSSLTANQSLADLEPMVRKGAHMLALLGWLALQQPRPNG